MGINAPLLPEPKQRIFPFFSHDVLSLSGGIGAQDTHNPPTDGSSMLKNNNTQLYEFYTH